MGRPETPAETAARKAATSKAHRSNQTALNLMVALAACVGVVLLIVLVVVRPDPAPRESVDYHSVAAEAQAGIDVTLADPRLPADWQANAATIETGSDDITSWYIGFITPGQQFIGMRQGIDANATWLAAQLERSRASGTASIDGVDWTLYDNREARDDPGNLAYAMTSEIDDSTLVLFGTADQAEFETLATALSAQLMRGSE